MSRVGAKLESVEFAAAVSECFRIAEPISESTVQERFRKSHGYRDFVGMLREAGLAPDARVLAIGCGRGLAGRSATYAAAVTREVYPAAAIKEMNYGLDTGDAPVPRYDMVVTHSLVHFALDPAPLCRFIMRALDESGCYVMANEPNARFWTNEKCVAELERVSTAESRRRQILKYAEPSRYVARLLRTVRSGETRDTTAEVNRLLHTRLEMSGDLTGKEIVRIVDPHVPDQMPGSFPLGSDGLDWDRLADGPLAGLKVEQVRTSGYVMRDNPDRVPARWREVNQELGQRFPLDGCSFTALWRRASR